MNQKFNFVYLTDIRSRPGTLDSMNRRLFHHQAHCEIPSPAIWLRFAIVFLLLFVTWDISTNTQAWGEAAAPMVVRAESPNPPVVSEAVVLADRIIARETDELLLDEKRRRELAREIESVLKRLRYAYPEVEKISARAAHLPGVLLLGVKPGLFQAVADLLEDENEPVALRTGNAAFDALNAKLGLKAVQPYRHTGVLVMHVSARANVGAARRAYRKIAGVEYAEPDAYLGDGSDVEAAKSNGAWHIVVRKAWGDCPSGCIYKKLFFFTVKEGQVERIEPPRAVDSLAFRKLLWIRRWR